ncbi:hypothetical protein O7599_16815 [Streptomyces sp. WMMC500]|uniref:hypothetical protein n=1 Tax=Streptomyces sp. WMMC500 TaxID=3015154 RepID=UPI00248C2B28|nr:hypothetical protein [Streptomyces sp. WMMC500]WBB64071.1 hypothetical protein O7599_16815 [Streptomyces sp. WMMC500]
MKESPARFADLAGLRLYRRNIFAVTGLPVDARGPAVRRQRQRLDARLAVERTWRGDARSPVRDGYRKEEVRLAFEEFQDPRRRLVDELTWYWGDADLGCGCAPAAHERHDEAVGAHLTAIEAETGRADLPSTGHARYWTDAAAGWARLLDSPGLRAHIAHRMTALADPRLDDHSPDDFLAGLPRLLLSPFAELADDRSVRPRLAEVCADWAEYPVFATPLPDVFEDTVEETADRLKDALRTAGERHEAGQHADALETLEQRVLPAYAEFESLEKFVSESRSEEMAHTVTVALNNVALGMCEAGLQRPFRSRLVEVMEAASRIAPTRDQAQIDQNLTAVRTGHAPAGAQQLKPSECAGCVLMLLTIVGGVVAGLTAGAAWATGIIIGGFVLAGMFAS